MQLPEKWKTFSQFFVPFIDNASNFKHFEKKKMIAIGNVFPKLQTVKILVRALSKNRRFRIRFYTERVKVSQILSKSSSENFYQLSSSFWAKLIWKMSPLLLGEIFGDFVDTLPPDGKYPVEHHSQFKRYYLNKQNLFLNFLFHFCNLHQISNILKKWMMLIAVFPKLNIVKNFVRPLCKKHRFGTRFDTQHDKVSQILA